MPASEAFVEDLVATFEAATEANLNTPGRDKNVVRITPELGNEVMITADLHGHRRNFAKIRRIADLANNPKRHLILQEVCHGGPTYPSNGGCMSHTMLEDVARLKVAYPDRVHFMMSNHELSELTEYPILKVGKMLNLMFRLGITEMYGDRAERVRDAYLAFIRSCPLGIWVQNDILICHSAPENVDTAGFDGTIFERELEMDELKEGSEVFRMVWGRDYRPENAEAFASTVKARLLIHGHTPCENGYNAPNDWQIILDCCAEPASYVILPTGEEFSHEQVVERIAML